MLSKKNYITFKFLRSQGYKTSSIINFLLKETKSKGVIVKELGVSRSMISQVINGRTNSTRIKRAIIQALGFDPWIPNLGGNMHDKRDERMPAKKEKEGDVGYG